MLEVYSWVSRLFFTARSGPEGTAVRNVVFLVDIIPRPLLNSRLYNLASRLQWICMCFLLRVVREETEARAVLPFELVKTHNRPQLTE
jgi:hypothetical protein